MSTPGSRDIAIIGYSFKLPGGSDQETFWATLLSDEDAIGDLPAERRWDWPDSPEGPETVPVGSIADVYRCDCSYFNLSPAEAAVMDPRQRLFLESATSAADTAGYGGEKLWGTATGVFVGASNEATDISTHQQTQFIENATHHAGAMIANRVSHYMNLHGPSLTIDTLCSSTLSAIDAACRSLRSGECGAALAGGIHLIQSHRHIGLLKKMNLISPTGQCRAFDESADGFVPGEGVGVFLLKPLEAAESDGDMVWGVIRGTAVAHAGRSENPLLPDTGGVSRVIRAALQDAGIEPEALSFIETGGTGTPFGDALEFRGIQGALQKTDGAGPPCGLGAVKTRIGNLEAAAGVGALVKTLLSFKHETIPGNLHFKRINPLIPISTTRFYLPAKTGRWKTAGKPKRVGINACGIGGTNAHLIVEAPPERPETSGHKERPTPLLLCISAHTHAALRTLCTCYLTALESDLSLDPWDFCATHNTGRTHFPCGLAIVAEDRTELVTALREIDSSPEDQWKNLANVFRQNPLPAEQPGTDCNILSHLREQYRNTGESRPYRWKRPLAIVLLNEDSGPYETTLKQMGIHPDMVLRQVDDDLKKLPPQPRLCIGLEQPSGSFAEAPFIHVSRTPDYAERVQVAAAVYAHGGPVDFESFYRETPFRKQPLPPYPYVRQNLPRQPQQKCAAPPGVPELSFEPLLHDIRSSSDVSGIQDRIITVLIQAMAGIGGYAAAEIDPDRTFSDCGINSIVTTQIAALFSSGLDLSIEPSLFGQHDTIRRMAAFLASQCAAAAPVDKGESPRQDPVELIPAGPSHLAAVRRWFDDPALTQWLDPFFQAGTDARSFGFFLSKRDKRTSMIHYRQQPVGICGLIDIDRHNGSAESWLVIGEEWARAAGVAVSAGTALCEIAFGELHLRTLSGKVRTDNGPALSLMNYTGWRHVGLLSDSLRHADRFHDRHLFQITADEFTQWHNRHTG